MTATKILKWINDHTIKHGRNPRNIPITKIEAGNIYLNTNMFNVATLNTGNSLFGLDIDFDPKADFIRSKRLEVSYDNYMNEVSFDTIIKNQSELHLYNKVMLDAQVQQLKAYIVTDKTQLELTFEVDFLASLKRFLHIERFFPIKTQQKIVDCSMLYPYCKVQFPHNKHSFHVVFHK